jgi:hypothetical protein
MKEKFLFPVRLLLFSVFSFIYCSYIIIVTEVVSLCSGTSNDDSRLFY